MTQYRYALPQQHGGLFLTDGGLETTLLFHEGRDLPCFAAFPLLDEPAGVETLKRYYRRHATIALKLRTGFVLESATWRASQDWGQRLGYSAQRLAEVNRKSIDLLVDLREQLETAASPMPISGCVGPRGDGYVVERAMTPEEARDFHSAQVRVFARTEADFVTAITMTSSEEAVGFTWAARDVNLPAVVSFTVETDGRLPSGQSLGEAIDAVDSATGRWPAYYMLNCAHPRHFEGSLDRSPWLQRIGGVRANASQRSHAELDEATDLDDGDPEELGADYARLRRRLPWLNVLGGCCGTDHRHIEQIALSCMPLRGPDRIQWRAAQNHEDQATDASLTLHERHPSGTVQE